LKDIRIFLKNKTIVSDNISEGYEDFEIFEEFGDLAAKLIRISLPQLSLFY
jgi:hypothetical protein